MMDRSRLCYKDKLRNYYIAGTGLFSGLLFGYITAIIAGILPIAKNNLLLTNIESTILAASILLTASLGALCSGRLADNIGRKNVILLCGLLYIIGSMVSILNYNYFLLLFSRLINGIALGISSFVTPLYLGEVAVNKHRGKIVLINSLGITSGIVIAYVISMLTSNIKIYLTFPILLSSILFYFTSQLQERVKTNVVKNNNVEARHKKILIIGITLALLQQFSGINFILYYTPFMFENSINIKTVMIFIGLINLIFTFVAVVLIDVIGRKKLLIIGFSIMAMTMFIASYNLYLNGKVNNIIIINILIFIASFAMSIGSVFWVIISEIYPQHLRARMISFMTFVNWFANFLVSLIFIPLALKVGVTSVFISFAFVSLFGISFTYYYLPETKGSSLEQVNI